MGRPPDTFPTATFPPGGSWLLPGLSQTPQPSSSFSSHAGDGPGDTPSRSFGHRLEEPSGGACRRCLPAPSAAPPAHSTAREGHPSSPGDPQAPSPASSTGPGATQGSHPRLWGWGGAAQPKGRAGALPIAAHAGNPSSHRAGRLLPGAAAAWSRGDVGMLWGRFGDVPPSPKPRGCGALAARTHQRALAPGPG